MENNEQIAPEVETEARDYGWAPEEEFKGPKDRWRPADQYLDWAKQTGRLKKGEFEGLKKEFPVLKQQNEALKSELSEIKDTMKQFVEFSSKAEERAYHKAKSEIEARIEQAAANADPVAARAAAKELEDLKPEAPKARTEEPAKPTVKVDPEIQDWIGKETWFTKDRTLNAFATDVYGELERSKPGMSTADLLAETKRRTVDKFPEKFGVNPRREDAASVATPSGQTLAPRSRKKTYEDLPAEAKKACDKYVATMPGFTREKYVALYEWD